jgi:hypothetical protein
MALSNPAFSNTTAFSQKGRVAAPSATELDELYGRPAAGPAVTDRMSYEDVIIKTVSMFVVLLVGSAVGAVPPGPVRRLRACSRQHLQEGAVGSADHGVLPRGGRFRRWPFGDP